MPLTLKINLGNDIRRVTVSSLTLLDLQNLVQKLFGESLPAQYTLKYRDDENDLVTVSSEIELQEALSSSKGILKFMIVPLQTPQTQSGTNQFGDVLENVFKRIAELNPLLFQVIQQWVDEFTENKAEPPSTPSCPSRCNPNANCNEKESEVVHPATCDHCQQTIRGIRYKCATCPDYDLCSQCLPLREKVHPEHKFWAIQRPYGFGQRRGFCGRPPVHFAVCDSCEGRIVGIRHKCKECPDYDLCSQCFQIQQEVHPGHSFETIERPSFPGFRGHFGGPRGCPFMARRCQRPDAQAQQPEAPKEEPAKEEQQPATPQPTEAPVPVSTPVATPSPVPTPETPKKETPSSPVPEPAPSPAVTEQPKKADTESVEFKLTQLAEMGFTDKETNLNLLVKHRGNLVNVIRDLLN